MFKFVIKEESAKQQTTKRFWKLDKQLLSRKQTSPMTLILFLRRMFPKNGDRDDKLCLLQNNSLLLPRFSYRVRLTPQKKGGGGGQRK